MRFRSGDAYMRVVREDHNGPFLLWNNRVYRPTQPTKHNVGDKAFVEGRYSYDSPNTLRITDPPQNWYSHIPVEFWFAVKNKPDGHYHCDC